MTPETVTPTFSIDLLTQDPGHSVAARDPLSTGTIRVTMAGVEIWNDTTNLTSTALCLLRTTRSDFTGPIEGVSDTNPLIHHCGLLPEMGCPIGASWSVQHVGDCVHIDLVVRASEIDEDVAVTGLPLPLVIDRVEYADQIRAFAIAVRAGIERESDRSGVTVEPHLEPVFAGFWNEYSMLLSSRDLIALELTAPVIEEMLASSEWPIVEAAPGMFLTRVCDPDRSSAIVERANRGRWESATIHEARNVDRSIRDAEVFLSAADSELIDEISDLLLDATSELVDELAPDSVLREVQLVRYHTGGHYLDHRDTPILGATPRTLSLVWYLNDGFSGGETTFIGPDVIVTPVAGVALIFSPVLMHRAEPIVAGVKYAVIAWYHDPQL